LHRQRRLIDRDRRQRSGTSIAVMVVPMLKSSMPVTSTMSPAAADSTGMRSSPEKPSTCPILDRVPASLP
jgi:hypothetical protein